MLLDALLRTVSMQAAGLYRNCLGTVRSCMSLGRSTIRQVFLLVCRCQELSRIVETYPMMGLAGKPEQQIGPE